MEKRNRRAIEKLVLVAAVCLACGSSVAEPVFEIEVTVGFAGPVQLKDGRLLAVYRHLDAGHSSDGGKTWKPAGPLADKAGTAFRKRQRGLLRPQSLIRLQSGALAVNYWQRVPGNGMARQAMFFVKSTDEGKTWSDPVQVSWPNTPAYPTWMIQTKAGRIVMGNEYWFPHRPSDTGVGLCTAFYSDNEGATWAESADSLILRRKNGAIWDSLQVPCVAETADGRLLMFMRNEVGRIARSYSKDGGMHWTPAELTDLVSSNSEIWLTKVPTTGDLLCVWNQASTEEIRKGYYRGRLTSAISKDSGKTWQHFRTVADSRGMKRLSRVVKPRPPAYLTSPGAVPPKKHVAPEGFQMNTFPRVKFVGQTAYLVHNQRLYAYPKGATRWIRKYNVRKLRTMPISWFYEGRTPAGGAKAGGKS